MNLEGWTQYGISCCPLSDCDYSKTWATTVDQEWLEAQLKKHVTDDHEPMEWVREVVSLQWQLVKLHSLLHRTETED